MFLTNPLHAVENGGRNDIHHQRRAPILYEYVDNIKMNIFIVIIIWSLAYGCGNNEIDVAKNAGKSTTVPCGAHCPMKHIQDFTQSQWMLSLGEFLHRIAVVAAMVNDFSQKHKTLPKIIC